jgi:hypothetical protein
LATITSSGKVSNSSTTATTANNPNTIVLRDGSGNFTASNVSTNANLTGPVTSVGNATAIANGAITNVMLTNDVVTSDKILDGSLVDADINTAAAIADTKLATITSSGKVSNSATTATTANNPNTIVLRDGSGNFTATDVVPKIYTTGLNAELGGYVFYVTPDGRHGLVAATQDQCDDCTWYSAEDEINKRSRHDTNGQQFTNWRLPTFYELGLLYGLKGPIGGFSTERYWSSTATGTDNAEYINFSNGSSTPIRGKANSYYVRAVRSF